MTSKTIVKTTELKRMADVANAENVTVELERDGTIYRVMPFTAPQRINREERGEAYWREYWLEREKRYK